MVISNFFRGMQESEASRIGRLSERVAEASIDSQKQVDEYNRPNPYTNVYYLSDEGRPYAFNSFTCSNSYFKGRAGGAGSSFKSCRYYSDQAKARRDAIAESAASESSA
mmetsp:Transcript_18452/g.45747  ORF Transcript_18452/g.45747 Transcript_18452/m.45747 type:complete len:109 (-) Transcript_18452:101-427(-)|eukprot:CAMPEP_0113607688 /NCGR_PEP_ID=MMETSP0017_2-20120614/3516_1 /TAXON_ID=2856 /ORGANISM="Cylindrotheca closterium" /LENGTH=108 /DNA_ID=CAMNT_0000516305 /DNA_START=96 /DNA_END=425 /DNA_ORIENTATION=+ /assembly_acc=CAM_ASM_000147